MAWLSRFFKKAPKSEEQPWSFVRLDFERTFPHFIWVSTTSYDSEAPDGFRYKMFATRIEPEMMIELLLLREMEDGSKRIVVQAQAPLENLETSNDIVRELESSANVVFERFDLSSIRTFDEFRSRAIDFGWETAHTE